VFLTDRDFRLLRDVALSHVLSRDQILGLGYFGSVTRANTRLRELRGQGLIQPLATPFFGQNLYGIGAKGRPVLGDRIGRIVAARTGSPRFLQHALMVTSTRIALMNNGASAWRFEQQLTCTFAHRGKAVTVRPDGLARMPSGPVVIEVDLGHVAPANFAQKLAAYDAFLATGNCRRIWHIPNFKVLAVTTSRRRAASLAQLLPSQASYELRCVTFEELGLPIIGGWS
jgi:hypothetical protein